MSILLSRVGLLAVTLSFALSALAGGGGADGAYSYFKCDNRTQLEVVQTRWLEILVDGACSTPTLEIAAKHESQISEGPVLDGKTKVGYFRYDWSAGVVNLKLDSGDVALTCTFQESL